MDITPIPDESFQSQYQRFLNDDVRRGDCIKDKAYGTNIGFVVGAGTVGGKRMWPVYYIETPDGRNSLVFKDDAEILGYGRKPE